MSRKRVDVEEIRSEPVAPAPAPAPTSLEERIDLLERRVSMLMIATSGGVMFGAMHVPRCGCRRFATTECTITSPWAMTEYRVRCDACAVEHPLLAMNETSLTERPLFGDPEAAAYARQINDSLIPFPRVG